MNGVKFQNHHHKIKIKNQNTEYMNKEREEERESEERESLAGGYHFFLGAKSEYHFLDFPEESSATLCSSSWFLHCDSTRASLVCASSSSRFLSLCSELRESVNSSFEPNLAWGGGIMNAVQLDPVAPLPSLLVTLG